MQELNIYGIISFFIVVILVLAAISNNFLQQDKETPYCFSKNSCITAENQTFCFKSTDTQEQASIEKIIKNYYKKIY